MLPASRPEFTPFGATPFSAGSRRRLTIDWSGGQPSSYIQIIGQSVTSGTPSVGATFQCFVPQSAGTFTVPAYVLSALPAGKGPVQVENFTANVPFTVSGVEYPYSKGGNTISVTSTFQ